MYKLKIDLILREPIVLELEDRDDAYRVRHDIEFWMKRDSLIHLNWEHGYQGRITINPAYVRTLEVVEE